MCLQTEHCYQKPWHMPITSWQRTGENGVRIIHYQIRHDLTGLVLCIHIHTHIQCCNHSDIVCIYCVLWCINHCLRQVIRFPVCANKNPRETESSFTFPGYNCKTTLWVMSDTYLSGYIQGLRLWLWYEAILAQFILVIKPTWMGQNCCISHIKTKWIKHLKAMSYIILMD